MKITTHQLGEIEVDVEKKITFVHGIPGFEHLKEFVVIQTDAKIPFAFLQSIEDGGVSFIVTNPFVFFPDYEFDLPVPVKEELKLESEQDCAVWAIVSVKQSLQDATLNLLAPVIMNTKEKLGKQVVLNGTPYRTRHSLPVTGEGKGGMSDAGSVAQER